MSTFICFDIGGTKCSVGLFEKQIDSYTLLYSESKDTLKGKIELKKVLSSLFSSVMKVVAHSNLTIQNALYISMIGDFGLDRILANGSASNISSFDGEFDGMCLNYFFSECFNTNMSLCIVNDGLSQCCGGYYAYNQLYKNYSKSVISYLGLGTGLGGAFAEINSNKRLTFFTDGHVSRVKLNSRVDNSVCSSEKLLSSHYFNLLGISDVKKALSKSNLDKKIKIQLSLLGAHFCDLADFLFGDSIDYHSKWTNQDILKIKQTDLLLIGGSIGVSELTKPFLFDIYTPHLKELNPNLEVFLISNTFNSALLGAYLYFL